MRARHTRAIRGTLLVIAAAVAATATIHSASAAGANPNLTPLLFSQDPTESAQVYAKSQAFAATAATSCGSAVTGAVNGGCCPTSQSDGACDDHDPTVTGCADASSTTPAQANIVDGSGTVIGLIETRYSPACHTNWARITGFGAYATAVKQSTICRGTMAQYSDSGCSDTDTGTESTRFSDQLYAPAECATAFGTLVLAGTSGTPAKFSAQTPAAC